MDNHSVYLSKMSSWTGQDVTFAAVFKGLRLVVASRFTGPCAHAHPAAPRLFLASVFRDLRAESGAYKRAAHKIALFARFTVLEQICRARGEGRRSCLPSCSWQTSALCSYYARWPTIATTRRSRSGKRERYAQGRVGQLDS